MRIGAFSARFSLPVSTVHYYIDNGLLVPLKSNGQYRFSKADIREMDMVNKLKSLSFTIQEIKEFLQAVRTYNTSDYQINAVLKNLYFCKQARLERQINKLTAITCAIKAEITSLEQEAEPRASICGMPLACVPLLACPGCESALNWEDVSLRDNQIYSGQISCRCGYRAQIEDGIIVTNSDTSFYMSEKFHIEHYQRGSEKDDDFVYFEYMNRISQKTTTMIHKSYVWMDAALSALSTSPRVIVLPDLSAHYLYKYSHAPYFKNALIIVSGFTKKNILAVKSRFDAIERNLNIIYVANTIFELPIKKGTIDLWIDAIASYNFSFFHYQDTLHQLLAPYFTGDAIAVGLTKYIDAGAKSLQNIKELYSRSHRENSSLPAFHRILRETGWFMRCEEVHGYVREPGDYYEYMDKADKHWFYSYMASRDNRL